MIASAIGLSGDRNARVRGLLLGAAVGDALGWPQEQRSAIIGGANARNIKARAAFREWERNSGTQFARYREVVRHGEYSDDTQLLLAVARACQHGEDWFDHLTNVELPTWVVYQRGGGRAVIAAARSWGKGTPPWLSEGKAGADAAKYFLAGSNGAAMRVAPHVLVSLGHDDPQALVIRALKDGIATHGHPRALLGSIAHAMMMRFTLLRSETLGYGDLLEQLADDASWRAIELRQAVPPEWLDAFATRADDSAQAMWKRTADEFQGLLDIARRSLRRGAVADDEATLGELGCFDTKVNGAGTVTAAAAAYIAARSAARPITGLLRSAFLRNADTDTLASMVGSILGALHGVDWLGDLGREVQDNDYIARFADLDSVPQALRSPVSTVRHNVPGRVRSGDLNRFAHLLESESANNSGKFVDGRGYVVAERRMLDSRTAASVERWRLRLTDGQVIIIDHVRRDTKLREPARDAESLATRPTARTGSSVLQRVTLLVDNLPAMAGFYRNVIGLPVRGTGDGVVDIGQSFRLRTRRSKASGATQVILEVVVPELDEVLRRLGPDAPKRTDGRVEVHDPEGNLIVLQQIEAGLPDSDE